MPDHDPSVAAIVVNWNQGELTVESIESLYTSDYSNLFVIVVDNGSRDGSVELIRKQFPKSVVIANEKNRGFALANNQGLDEAHRFGADYVFFLNNDAAVKPNTIRILIEYLKSNPAAVAVAPFIFYYDKPEIIWYGGGSVALWRGWIGHRHIREKYEPSGHKPRQTGYLTGCAVMMKVDLVQSLKGFDSSFGIYSEDVDLSLRLRKHGELHVVPDAHVLHRVSASAGGELTPMKAFYRGRSNVILLRRYARFREWLTIIPGGVLGGIIASLGLIIKGKPGTVKALWLGVANGITGTRIPSKYKLDMEL